MKYTIFTLGNPERQERIRKIREAMSSHDEVFIECVNGKDHTQLTDNMRRNGFRHLDPEWRPGEGGLWYTNVNAWRWALEHNENLLTFEDDAIPTPFFNEALDRLEVLEEFDFASLYIPYRNDRQTLPFMLGPTQQEHGNICVAYSPKGAEKILDMLSEDGIQYPIDIWLYKKGLSGELAGYTPSLFSRPAVDHDFTLPTNIHEDDRIPTDAV